MPFIGNQPAKVPLTSADITDGIITSAKIADGTIVNADISSTSAITLNKLSGNPNFRNRIINGDMGIDQRNSGASVTTPTTATNVYTLDRWAYAVNAASKLTIQQSSTAPVGFINSALITSTSAYSILTSDYFVISQFIEGLNVADLAWGTANAKTVTLSFWVRSSLTGTFGGALQNSAQNRSYPFSYTISSANTFEYKTITITGDTSGTWLTTNGIGIRLRFSFGTGSNFSGTAGAWTGSQLFSSTGATSLVGTNGATLYITGVQLEAGTSATDFEFLPYDVSLGRCRRYYFKNLAEQNMPLASGVTNGTTNARYTLNFPSTMRASPTLSVSSASGFKVYCGTTNVTTTSIAFYYANTLNALIYADVASGLTNGQGTIFLASGTSDFIEGNSEL